MGGVENVMKSCGRVKDVVGELEVIEGKGKGLVRLVNELMDFGKGEWGGMNVILGESNMKSLLMNVYEGFEV